VVWNKL